jgi:ribosomal protein S18 acetylase RimI-like enzyme
MWRSPDPKELSMPKVFTRAVTSSDLPAVFEMVQLLAAHHQDASSLTLETLKRDVLGPSPWAAVIVASVDQVLCGYGALTPVMQLQFGVRGMDLHHLFVMQAHRGKGVGRRLVDASIAHAKRQECRYLTVGTHPDNHVAQNMYLAAGLLRRPAPGPRFSMKW